MTLPESSATTDSSWLTPAEPIDESITMPQTIAGVFDEAFDLYKRHFALLATIVAVGVIPIEILRNIVVAVWLHPLDAHLSNFTASNTDGYFLLRLGQVVFGEPRSGFMGVIAYIVLILLGAPISIAVSDLYFGRNADVKACYRRSAPYLLNMAWGYCLAFLIFVGIAFVGTCVIGVVAGMFVALFSAVNMTEAATVVFMGLMVLPYFLCFGFFARNFVFLTQLTVLEGLPTSYVSYRNFQLVGKKRFWRTWAAISALPILLGCFQAILHNSLLSAIQMLHLPSIVDFIAVSALNTAVYFFLAPYWAIFTTLLYYDYRVRREGFDVRLLSLATPEPAKDPGGES